MLADKSGLRKRDSLITPIKEIKPKSDAEVQKIMARFGIGNKKKKDKEAVMDNKPQITEQ